LKKLVDAEDYIGFAYSPDIQFLGADKAPFEAVKSSDLRAKIGTVAATVEEKGADPSALIQHNNTTNVYDVALFSEFVNNQSAAIKPSSAVNQAFTDWAFSNIISPFHNRFSGYLTDTASVLNTQVQTQNNEIAILDRGQSYLGAVSEVETFMGRCSSNSDLSRLPTCATLVKPGELEKIKRWLRYATAQNLLIPRNVMSVLSPYLNMPDLHPPLNQYSIIRLKARILREKNPDIRYQLMVLLMCGGVSSYFVMLCVGLGRIPKRLVDALAAGADNLALRAEAAADRQGMLSDRARAERAQGALENASRLEDLTARRPGNARLLPGATAAAGPRRLTAGPAAAANATGTPGVAGPPAAARANETLNSNSEGSNNNNAASGRGGRRVRKAKTSKKRHVKKHKGTRRH